MKSRIKFLLVVVAVVATMVLGENILKADVDAWPFLEVNKNHTTVCYPFYTRDKDFTMLLNFYVKSNHGKDTHIFWPFVKFSDGKLTKVIPFWFADKSNNFAFLPFVVHDNNSTLWLVPPVYSKDGGDYFAIYPFYIKSKASTFVFPNVYLEGDSRNGFQTVFPFYQHEYYTDKSRKSDKFRFMNYIHNVDEGGDDFKAFLPFYTSGKSEDENSTWCLNYYSKQSKDVNQLDVYPFFGSKQEKLEKGKMRNKLWIMWPFYSKETVTNNEGYVLSSKKRFLFFGNEKRSNGRRILSLLGFVVREELN